MKNEGSISYYTIHNGNMTTEIVTAIILVKLAFQVSPDE